MPDGRDSPSLDPDVALDDPSASGQGMHRATTARASRMARPAEPCAEVQAAAARAVAQAEERLRNLGMERVTEDDCKFKNKASSSTGKGPAVRADGDAEAAEQGVVNHVVSVKAKNVHSGSREPSWLLGTKAVLPQTYTRLAQSAFKANAVNSAVFKREQKQGASNQARRRARCQPRAR